MLSDLKIVRATLSDATLVADLSTRMAQFVGFFSRDAIREHIDYDHVRLAIANGEPRGYVIRGALRHGLFAHTRIFQLAIEPCDQRQLIGTALARHVSMEAQAACSPSIVLHCRDGIPANQFWEAIGFNLREVRLGGSKHRKMLNIWSIPTPPAPLRGCNEHN